MGTGRNNCPPDWAVQLTNLIQTLGAGCTGLTLQPLCDANGVMVGYGAAVYNGATSQTTMLYFDLDRQPVATLGSNRQPCAEGGARRGELLQSVGGVPVGYLLAVG